MKEERKITDVTESSDGYYITCDMSGCFLDKKYNVKPKEGDLLKIYTVQGSLIRGMTLNGKRIFYKTDQQLDVQHTQWVKEYREQQLKELDKQYDALPEFFKRRIDKYRENNKNFRVEYEAYELFCCNEAVVIADACKTAEKVREFINAKFDEQMKLVPKLSTDHSGNTIGAASALAYWYLKEPENVVKMYGALAPLVGSDEYGDTPKK